MIHSRVECHELEEAVAERAWRKLDQAEPMLASSIQLAVDHGANVAQIRNDVYRMTGEAWFAARCEQAAEYCLLQRAEEEIELPEEEPRGRGRKGR